jgi:uncharacterized protein (DUF169 family)
MTTGRTIQELLGLRAPPVAIAFLAAPPAGLPRWQGPTVPAGCAFWKEAQKGQAFYTVPADHFNCAVGAYTHAMDLPPERGEQLNESIGLMVENGYIELAEVPGIPRLNQAPAAVAYAVADATAFAPDVVLLTANPAQAMLIYEAALRAKAGSAETNLIGRPSCGVLPLTMSSHQAGVSLGCAGNRLYAGLRDDELYVTIPGAKWEEFKARLSEIVEANGRMSAYYRRHQAQTLSAPG